MFPRFAYFYVQSLGTWRFPHGRLRRFQMGKLRGTIRRAREHLPLYQTYFDESGPATVDFSTPGDIGRLPFLTKATVIANYPHGIRRRDIPAALVRGGSGTTGVKTEMAWSAEQLDLNQALLARRLTMAGVRPWMRVASLWPPASSWRKERVGSGTPAPMTTLHWKSAFSRLVGALPNVRAFPISYSMTREETGAIARFAPDLIQGNPSYLRRLGKAMRGYGLCVNPKAVICVNELFTEVVRKELRDVYQCKVLNSIGSTELGVVGSECHAQTGLHLNEDYMICEVINNGANVSPGGAGELVLTSLHNDVMPLIRYRTGDLVELGGASPCPCGSSLMRVTRILGRVDEGLVGDSGKRILPMDIAEEIEGQTGIRDYQIIQTGAGHITLRFAPDSEPPPAEVALVGRLIGTRLGRGVTVQTEPRREDELWKKNRPVISRLPVAP